LHETEPNGRQGPPSSSWTQRAARIPQPRGNSPADQHRASCRHVQRVPSSCTYSGKKFLFTKIHPLHAAIAQCPSPPPKPASKCDKVELGGEFPTPALSITGRDPSSSMRSRSKGQKPTPLLCPLLTSPVRSGPITPNSQSIPLARDGPGQHGRSPGVNTCLSRYCSAVYVAGLWQLGVFVLCCGLVPPDPPDSVSVSRIKSGTGSASCVCGIPPWRDGFLPGQLPPCTTATPLAAPSGRSRPGLASPMRFERHCLAGSGTCRARLCHGKLDSPLRSRAVPGTQPVV